MLIAAGPIGVGKSWIACPRGSGSGGGDLRIPIEGAIVTIDAIGTQKAIARKIDDKDADYVLALKENQGSLYRDVADFFADPALASACPECRQTDVGHGRIEEREARAADAAWLAERHPQWVGMRSIAEITATRTDKKTGQTSTETRLYISSLPPRSGAHPWCLPVALEH